MPEIVSAVMEKTEIKDIRIEETDLAEIVMESYKNPQMTEAAAG